MKQIEKYLKDLSSCLNDGSIIVDDSLNSKTIVNSIAVNCKSIRMNHDMSLEAEKQISKDKSSLSAIQQRIKKWLIKNFEKKNLVKDVQPNNNLSRMTIAEELK